MWALADLRQCTAAALREKRSTRSQLATRRLPIRQPDPSTSASETQIDANSGTKKAACRSGKRHLTTKASEQMKCSRFDDTLSHGSLATVHTAPYKPKKERAASNSAKCKNSRAGEMLSTPLPIATRDLAGPANRTAAAQAPKRRNFIPAISTSQGR